MSSALYRSIFLFANCFILVCNIIPSACLIEIHSTATRSICCCNSFFLSKFFLMRDGEDLFQIHSQCCQFFIIKFSYSLLSSSTAACSLLLSVDSTLLFLDVIWGLLFLYINVHHQKISPMIMTTILICRYPYSVVRGTFINVCHNLFSITSSYTPSSKKKKKLMIINVDEIHIPQHNIVNSAATT